MEDVEDDVEVVEGEVAEWRRRIASAPRCEHMRRWRVGGEGGGLVEGGGGGGAPEREMRAMRV